MKSGLTSVTFRSLSWQKIIDLALDSGQQGIEWGGDIHCPAGDLALAETIGAATRAAGLEVFAYGSYYKLGEGMDFHPVLETGAALGAPVIRIWAGTKGSLQSTPQDYDRLSKEGAACCELARKKGILVCTEYHRGTLTDSGDSAVKLLRMTQGLKTYWQPNPDLTVEQNKKELQQVLPWLHQLHVFHWTGANIRHPLQEGAGDWKEYLSVTGTSLPAVLEFVEDDSPDQYQNDAQALTSWLSSTTF